MDDLTNRIMAVAFAFVWIFAIIVVILLVWMAPDESITRLNDFVGYLDDHNNTEAQLLVTFGGIILVLLATLLILFEVMPPSTGNLKIQQMGGGDVEISAEEACLRVEEELRAVPGVDQAEAKITGRGKKADVHLTIHVAPDANLAHTADEARTRASAFMEEKMGVQLARPPSAEVHYRELRVSDTSSKTSVQEEPPAPSTPPSAAPDPSASPSETRSEDPPQEGDDAPRDPASGA